MSELCFQYVCPYECGVLRCYIPPIFVNVCIHAVKSVLFPFE